MLKRRTASAGFFSQSGTIKHLKVLLGRLVRICQREIAKAKLNLSARQQEILNKIKKIQVQSILSKAEKEQYKEETQ